MSKILPSTVVEMIEGLNPKLGILPRGTAGRLRRVDIDAEKAQVLKAIVKAVEQIPDELLQMSSDSRAQLLVAIENIRHAVCFEPSPGTSSLLLTMNLLDQKHQRESNRFATEVIGEVLSRCGDQPIRSSTNSLSFINDQILRESLQQDLTAIDIALSTGGYKAATVLGGSMIEALLLWRLAGVSEVEIQSLISAARSTGKLSGEPPTDRNKWALSEMLEVAATGRFIRDETATIVRLAKDFRNLVHPGRSIRLGQSCNRGTALSVVAAIEQVVEDFTNNPL